MGVGIIKNHRKKKPPSLEERRKIYGMK